MAEMLRALPECMRNNRSADNIKDIGYYLKMNPKIKIEFRPTWMKIDEGYLDFLTEYRKRYKEKSWRDECHIESKKKILKFEDILEEGRYDYSNVVGMTTL